METELAKCNLIEYSSNICLLVPLLWWQKYWEFSNVVGDQTLTCSFEHDLMTSVQINRGQTQHSNYNAIYHSNRHYYLVENNLIMLCCNYQLTLAFKRIICLKLLKEIIIQHWKSKQNLVHITLWLLNKFEYSYRYQFRNSQINT